METSNKKQTVTKTFTKLALPLMACAVMLYSSCRKSDMVAPSVTTTQTTKTTKPSNDALTKQIVADLARSLGGACGGASARGGGGGGGAGGGRGAGARGGRGAAQGD